MSNIIEVVESFFEFGEKIVVAVSGGADSMALLHCLMHSKKKFNLVVAHLNHCLRGKESERDEDFVRNFCLKNNLKFVVKREKVREFSLKEKISLEEAGRIKRYEFFEELEGKIATAHTLSDVVETFFINILRGCALKGLISIPEKRGRILRPLISFTRKEIEDYCKKNSIFYVNDSTNFELNFLRNKIRFNVIPELKNISASFEKNIFKTLKAIKVDEEFLEDVTNEKFNNIIVNGGIELKKISKLKSSIKVRIIIKFLKYYGITASNEMLVRIIKLCNKGFGKESLPKNKLITIKKGNIIVEENLKFKMKEVLIPKKGEFCYDNLIFINCNAKDYLKILNKTKHLFLFRFCYDKIVGDVFLRNRKERDEIKLFKRPTKTLKKLMQEKGLRINEKQKRLVLADELGVFWVFGFGLDVRVLPNEKSERLCLVFEMFNFK